MTLICHCPVNSLPSTLESFSALFLNCFLILASRWLCHIVLLRPTEANITDMYKDRWSQMPKSYGEKNHTHTHNNLVHKSCLRNPSICFRIKIVKELTLTQICLRERKTNIKSGAEQEKSTETRKIGVIIRNPSYLLIGGLWDSQSWQSFHPFAAKYPFTSIRWVNVSTYLASDSTSQAKWDISWEILKCSWKLIGLCFVSSA